MLSKLQNQIFVLVIVAGLLPFVVSEAAGLVTTAPPFGRFMVMVTAGLIGVFGATAGHLLAKPIIRVTRELEARLGYVGPRTPGAPGEAGRLTAAFNSLLGSLEQARGELVEAKQRYEALTASGSEAILVLDPKNRKVVEANKSAERLLGYSIRELYKLSVSELHAAAESRRIEELLETIEQEGHATLDDLMFQTKDGRAIWADVRCSQITSAGRPLIQCVVRDTTEKKRQYVLTEKEISFIHELSRTLPLFQDFDQMLERVLGMLNEALPFNAFALVLREPEAPKALVYVAKKSRARFVNEIKSRVAEVLVEMTEDPTLSNVKFEVQTRGGIAPADGPVGSQIMLPLAVVDGVAGLFSVRTDAYKKEDLSLFSTMVSGISSLYIAYKSYLQVQELSVTDSLTGLFNRRKFFEELDREVARAGRYGSKLSIIMLDIDHFKNVNDEYGHQAGDQVLRALAQVLRDNTRQTDIVARYGGEEFIIMLTETPRAGAAQVATRIKERVEQLVVEFEGRSVRFTVSCGASAFELGDTCDGLVSRTDKALYEAKRKGRNRVEVLTA